LTNTRFQSLGISDKFQNALAEAKYVEPSKIQARAIPVLLDGADVLGVAQTGTGKTAAFGLPLLQRLDAQNSPATSRHPRALIMAPTRELAIQIHSELSFFARPTALSLTCIYGGVGQNPQVKALRKGVDILVATPGRLLDLVAQNHVNLGQVSVLILDEADRLLDMGFIRDVKKIVAMTPRKRQSLLFSATMPGTVASLAAEILSKPVRIEVAPKQATVKKIEQRVVLIDNADKQQALEYLLFDAEVKKAIVFTRTKHGADKVARKLRAAGIGAEAIHGNKSQNARTRTLQSFKDGESWVLVATDIAARGIDIDGVTHVFNQELPHEPESYVHRIGRTGRAGASGTAWSLVDPGERKRLRAVEKLIRMSLPVIELDLPPRAEVEPKAQLHNESNRHKQTHSDRSSGQGSKRRRPRRRKVRAEAA
jgi:ATP-dependent RNA helicase RhlE